MLKLYKYTILTQRWKNRLDIMVKDNSGSAAIEFAFVAAPFFFLVFGLLEISLIFIVSVTLEHGLNEATRQIRTGSFQSTGGDRAKFERDICSELFGLLDCETNLGIDVRTFDKFAGAGFASGTDTNGNYDPGSLQFAPGTRNEIVLARAFYEWELIIPFISSPLSNLDNGNLLITASTAFRNEPF